jgi:hypothetical protein
LEVPEGWGDTFKAAVHVRLLQVAAVFVSLSCSSALFTAIDEFAAGGWYFWASDDHTAANTRRMTALP